MTVNKEEPATVSTSNTDITDLEMAIAEGVRDACKWQAEKGRTIDNINVDSIVLRVKREFRPAKTPTERVG